MYKNLMNKFPIPLNIIGSSLVIAIASVIANINLTFAQSQNLPVCQPPNPGEYLLLIISPTQSNQNQLRRALPNEIQTTVCRYLNDTVTRIGGFNKIDDANRWARYINNIVGLSAIITTRPGESVSALTQTPQTPSYQPQRLGNGFAVLVDYFNRPEVANQVKEVVGGDVGFVSYGQRPYLLAIYTTDQKNAYSILDKLSARGFFPIIVDSSKVMLLRSIVNLPQN